MNKKRYWKRGLGVLAIGILGLLLFWGGNNVEEKGKKISESEVPEITIAYIGDRQEDMQMVEAAINEILVLEVGAKIKLISVNLSDYQEEYRMQLSRGDSIDIAVVLLPDFNDFVSENMLLELTAYLEKYGDNIKDSKEKSELEYAKIQDSIYGITVQQEWNTQTYVLMRKDLLEKYDLDISGIEELSDCEKIFSVMKEEEPQLEVICGTSGMGLIEKFGSWEDLTDKLGVIDFAGDETRVVNLYETDTFLSIAEVLYSFYQKGYITDNAALTLDSEQEQMRAGGVFAYLAAGYHDLAVEHSNRSGYELVAVPIGDYGNYATTTNAMFNMWTISRKSTQPELAMKVLDYIYGNIEICNLLNWGIEGIHYEVVDEIQGIIGYPIGTNAENSGYHMNMTWMFPNAFSVYRWENSGQLSKEENEEKNRNLEKTRVFGFLYDSAEVNDKIQECQKIIEYYKPILYYGLAEPNMVVNEMNQKLYEAGLQDIIDEKQRQLDIWLKEQE